MYLQRDYKKLICERKGEGGEILWVTLNDEKIYNALTETMQQEFLTVLEEVAFDHSLRCVVLTGAGEKAFCSGGDIGQFQSQDNVSGYNFMYERGCRIQYLLNYMEKPVIAAVNGYCLAGGLELALCCDFIYASEKARFGITEINLGMLAGWGGTIRLPRKIPVNRAKEMIYRGEMISATDAYRLGLVNRVVKTKEELLAEVDRTAEEIMSKGKLALRAAKTVINNSITCDSIEAAQAIERGAIMWLQGSADMKEGVAAFLEKRKPMFTGK
jgi:enoyl-CoA hydratase